jgi:hypothetical protein
MKQPIVQRTVLVVALVLAALASKSVVNPDITARAQALNQVWTDPDTKLMWAVKDSGPYEPPTYGLLRQAEAAAYCKNSSLAGFHDWRLPTINELEEIYDKSVEGYHAKGGVIKPSGDTTGKIHYLYAQMNVWSQSEREDQEGIWEFDFQDGSRSTTVGGVGAARALCVRGAPAKAAVAATSAVTDMSKYVSADGITIPKGTSGAPRGSGVFFTTIEGSEQPISLRGNPALATLNYTGTMETTGDGKLAGGTEKFKPTQIKTSENLDKWLKVTSFSIGKDGFLVVKDESGASYKIKVAPVTLTGTIEDLGASSH